jgi:hypothetical protein
MRVGSFSTHVNEDLEKNLRGVRSLRCKSSGFTEMDPGRDTNIPTMKRVFGQGYTVCTDYGDHSSWLHSQEVPIVARHSGAWKLESQNTYKIAEMIGDGGIGNDRYLQEARYRGKLLRHRRVVHMQTHLMAAIQGPEGRMNDTDRRKAMDEAVEIIEDRIYRHQQDDAEVILTGDWNWREVKGRRWVHSPIAVARRHNMGHFSSRLDWVLWTHRHLKVVNRRVIEAGTGINNADHDWIITDFRWKK